MGIEWDERWSIGDELIDSQHKGLVKLVNDIVFSCEESDFDIPAALSFLVNYTVTHFDDEEKLQQKHGFPEYKKHKQMHEDLKETVGKLVAEYEKSGSTANLKKALDKVLAAWLMHHIEVEDKKIGDHIAFRRNMLSDLK